MVIGRQDWKLTLDRAPTKWFRQCFGQPLTARSCKIISGFCELIKVHLAPLKWKKDGSFWWRLCRPWPSFMSAVNKMHGSFSPKPRNVFLSQRLESPQASNAWIRNNSGLQPHCTFDAGYQKWVSTDSTALDCRRGAQSNWWLERSCRGKSWTGKNGEAWRCQNYHALLKQDCSKSSFRKYTWISENERAEDLLNLSKCARDALRQGG